MNWWKKLKAWLAKKFAKPVPKPDPVPDPQPEPKPVTLYNDTDRKISIRQAGREVQNEGQVTYLQGVLTTRPLNGWRNVCVQYDNVSAGEVTLWKELNNNAERKDIITPSAITKIGIVCWYER